MAILEIQRPYEFLARWDTKTGTLKGSHVVFSTVLEKDGVFLSEEINDISEVGETAFPLADILSTLQIDALSQITALNTLLSEKEAALTAANNELAQLRSEDPVVDQGIIKISAPQFLQALTFFNLRDTVETYINASADNMLKDFYYRSPEFWSNDRKVLAVATVLGLNETDILSVFNLGKTL
jgi:hypothetical protein